jgi:hypothetical protein
MIQLSRRVFYDKPTRFRLWLLVALIPLAFGCQDDIETIRKIQADRQARRQAETKVDHLGEMHSLVSRLIELDPVTAERQIVYHLNAWRQAADPQASDASKSDDASKSKSDDGQDSEDVPTDLLKTVSDVIPFETAMVAVTEEPYITLDVNHLRYCYLARQVTNWVLENSPTDPLWDDWLQQSRESLGAENAESLAAATKLFDWVVRNIADEPLVLTDTAPPVASLPLGMTFRGPGYRQTPYQTLFRGTGDALQRSGTFMALCRQASISSCLLALADGAGGFRPWLVGVLIDKELYLFDCGLGIPVPGPNQTGIATLSQARSDASVLRRMNVPGWFEYPVQKDDVQQCAALLMAEPESISIRSKRLQAALTGDSRMVLYEDVAETAASLDALSGVATVRLWDVPLKSRVYAAAMTQVTNDDPMVAFFVLSPWSILEGPFQQAKQLSLGRWRHLQGRFDDNEEQSIKGAKPLYLGQRQPEFEIADLRIDVELQKQYGIRRELGVTPEVYDRQIQQVQSIMRQGKNTATYWLSLIQYDTNRFDLAENWFGDRVLGDNQESRWEPAARYNLARSRERTGKIDEAIELYKTEGDLQEHGNRIRARLLDRSRNKSPEDKDDKSDVDE